MTETRVTTSSGDNYIHLKQAGEAYAEINSLKGQIDRLKAGKDKLGLDVAELKKELREKKKELRLVERRDPLNDNDVRMLIESDVTMRFSRKFTGGAEIKATRNGRTVAVARGPESASLLPQVIKSLRADYRGK